jgi:putative CocE/NonD family hydrolase
MRALRTGVAGAMALAWAAGAMGLGTRPAGGGGAAPSAENRAAYIREHYTKHEYKIAMRDGVRLFTAVYVPKDDSVRYPILMTRTPYTVRPYGEDLYTSGAGTMAHYAAEKFIFVFQDVRGKNASEGTWADMRPILENKTGKQADESTDAYDTIDWLVKNVPGNNGKVGMTGISYPGFYSACGMIDSHPALKAVSPQAPITDWFMGDDMHHNGAFYLPHTFGFFSTFGQELEDPIREQPKRIDYQTNDGYRFYLDAGPLSNLDARYLKGKIGFWNDLVEHPNYDAYWQARNLRPHLKNVKAAVLTVGGWFDAEDLFGTLAVYRETERQNPGIFNALVMGPWHHGQWASTDGSSLGNVSFDAKTAPWYREHVELPFFRKFLKDDDSVKLAEATVFETGTNQWRRYETWPPKTVAEKSLYLRAGGKLSFEAPGAGERGFDEYVSDPAKPVPATGYVALGMTREHMVDDQRFAATRPDVLVYEGEVLEEDVTLAGPVTAVMKVSTTGTDADFIVKLIDVYSIDYPNPDNRGVSSTIPVPQPPATTRPLVSGVTAHPSLQMSGYQQLVRAEPMRARFRKSFEKPEALVPGEATEVTWTMPDVYHTFRRGHRIMIQVQSSWFPVVDRNPQTFVENIYKAKAEDFRKATQRVYLGAEGSCVKVQVLGR